MPTHRTRPGPWRLVAFVVFFTVAGFGSMILTRHPSNDRDWAPDQARLPRIAIMDSVIRIDNVRDFRYAGPDSFTVRYRTRDYDLRRLDTVWFVLTPFSKAWRGPAHSFVSFGFGDSLFVSISIEARRERGEEYGLLRGLGRNFELIYLIGEEEDVIGRRAAFGDFDVYLYPIRTTPERARELFVDLIAHAEQVIARPQFYNTLTNNCTSNLVASVNRVVPGRIPVGLKLLFPGYADDVARSLGLIDSTMTLDAARARYRINDLARAALGQPDFSRRIRTPRSQP
jgi:hypothetical protein